MSWDFSDINWILFIWLLQTEYAQWLSHAHTYSQDFRGKDIDNLYSKLFKFLFLLALLREREREFGEARRWRIRQQSMREIQSLCRGNDVCDPWTQSVMSSLSRTEQERIKCSRSPDHVTEHHWGMKSRLMKSNEQGQALHLDHRFTRGGNVCSDISARIPYDTALIRLTAIMAAHITSLSDTHTNEQKR